MKSIKQLSKQINIDHREIHRIIKRDNLITQDQDRLRVYLTDKQCEYITRIMFYERKCNYLIFESKMNLN